MAEPIIQTNTKDRITTNHIPGRFPEIIAFADGTDAFAIIMPVDQKAGQRGPQDKTSQQDDAQETEGAPQQKFTTPHREGKNKEEGDWQSQGVPQRLAHYQ